MNVFGETLAAILEDRGLSVEELEERANLDTGELREKLTGDRMDEVLDARLILAVMRALAVSKEEAVRLRFAYSAEERLTDEQVRRLANSRRSNPPSA